MIISKCEFYPPYREGAVVDVSVVINGVAVLTDISIVRTERKINGGQLCVAWPEVVVFIDDFAERAFENEILERYEHWIDEQKEILKKDSEYELL